MNWKILVLVKALVILTFLSGCQRDMLMPETKSKNFLPKNTFTGPAKTVMVSNGINDEAPSLSVQYESNGNNVFVECIVTGITFREADQANRQVGKMIVWIDGKKSQEVSAAAFIIKNLTSGNHKLKLEVVDQQNKSYGLSKEFMVNIPKS